MKLTCPIYGEWDEIEEVFEELICSSAFQRLKEIHQGGASYLVNEKWNVTRYDHSIGVMLLIRKLGGSIEEQIAGLLHDISHTAFSHVVDFVLDNTEENYHEHIYQKIIIESSIPDILSRHNYDYKKILFDNLSWTLLERPAPELCADRIDYTLRDLYHYGIITLEEIQSFLDNITVANGIIVVQNVATANWFVRVYFKEVIDFFLDPLNIYANELLTRILKLALDKQIISLEMMLGTDNDIMSLLRTSYDQNIQNILSMLHSNVTVIVDENSYDMCRSTKVRLIDPFILHGTELIPASQRSEEVCIINENARIKAQQGVCVRIISF